MRPVIFCNPSNASRRSLNNYLVEGAGITFSYNSKLRYPNWVAYYLKYNYSSLSRPDTFYPDIRMDSRIPIVLNSDFGAVGYDRGHMAPAEDLSSNLQFLYQSFMTTNVVLQNSILNRGVWKSLERYIRVQSIKGYELLVYTGALGVKAKHNHISIPDILWKCVYIMKDNKVIDVMCVCIPNDTIIEWWGKYLVSLDDLRRITSLSLKIPDNLVPSNVYKP